MFLSPVFFASYFSKHRSSLSSHHAKGDSFFHSDEQPELNLENDYPDKTGHNLKTNSSISIL